MGARTKVVRISMDHSETARIVVKDRTGTIVRNVHAPKQDGLAA